MKIIFIILLFIFVGTTMSMEVSQVNDLSLACMENISREDDLSLDWLRDQGYQLNHPSQEDVLLKEIFECSCRSKYC